MIASTITMDCSVDCSNRYDSVVRYKSIVPLLVVLLVLLQAVGSEQ